MAKPANLLAASASHLRATYTHGVGMKSRRLYFCLMPLSITQATLLYHYSPFPHPPSSHVSAVFHYKHPLLQHTPTSTWTETWGMPHTLRLCQAHTFPLGRRGGGFSLWHQCATSKAGDNRMTELRLSFWRNTHGCRERARDATRRGRRGANSKANSVRRVADCDAPAANFAAARMDGASGPTVII